MVIHPRDTRLANAAVLAPRWLQELACRAREPGIVQYSIVRVVPHLLGVVKVVDVRLTILLRTQPQEHIWLREESEREDDVVPFQQMPDSR